MKYSLMIFKCILWKHLEIFASDKKMEPGPLSHHSNVDFMLITIWNILFHSLSIRNFHFFVCVVCTLNLLSLIQRVILCIPYYIPLPIISFYEWERSLHKFINFRSLIRACRTEMFQDNMTQKLTGTKFSQIKK